MDTMDEVAFVTFLGMRTRGVVGVGGTRRSGSLVLGGTGFGNKRAVPDARILVVFGWMYLATDVTGLRIKPPLPCRVRRPNRRGWGGVF